MGISGYPRGPPPPDDKEQSEVRFASGVRTPENRIVRKPTGYPRNSPTDEGSETPEAEVSFADNTNMTAGRPIQRKPTGYPRIAPGPSEHPADHSSSSSSSHSSSSDQHHDVHFAPGVRSPTGHITRRPTGYPRDMVADAEEAAEDADGSVQFDSSTQYTHRPINRKPTG